MTTKEMIEVMKAYDEGKQIQVRASWEKENYAWGDTDKPSWAWDEWEFRVKPQPSTRPFTYEEAVKHLGELVVRNDNYGTTCKLITAVHKYGDEVQINGLAVENFMKLFKFYDGSPCGVIEG